MDLETSFNSLSVQNSVPNVINFAAVIGGFHTEIVLTHFPNHINLFVTQFEKIGNLYQIKIDQAINGYNIPDPIYTVTTLFGGDNLEAEVAARYLTEKLGIRKTFILSLSLKYFNKSTVNQIVSAIESYRPTL